MEHKQVRRAARFGSNRVAYALKQCDGESPLWVGKVDRVRSRPHRGPSINSRGTTISFPCLRTKNHQSHILGIFPIPITTELHFQALYPSLSRKATRLAHHPTPNTLHGTVDLSSPSDDVNQNQNPFGFMSESPLIIFNKSAKTYTIPVGRKLKPTNHNNGRSPHHLTPIIFHDSKHLWTIFKSYSIK